MIKKTPDPLALPARKIGVKSRSVSGIVPKMGHYESTLERDFMEIIRFEGRFTSFTAQPLKIEFRGKSRAVEGYTPDGLIYFIEGSNPRKPLLFEIKHREDFRKDWRKLMPKFKAAKKYCASVGWDFMVLTEKEIRTPYLTNVKFLWPFKMLFLIKLWPNLYLLNWINCLGRQLHLSWSRWLLTKISGLIS